MSTASTTVYLYIGFDNERRQNNGEWPANQGGHIELVSWIEGMAITLDALYEAEFAKLDLGCVFDYDITETLGAWLYHNDSHLEFKQEARRLVAKEMFCDAMRIAIGGGK